MEQVRQRRWQFRPLDPGVLEELTQAGQPALLARLLASRGIVTPAALDGFLAGSLADLPDPFLMQGMERGVTRLLAAVQSGERICIYGDYDVDGITGVALLVSFLRAVGADVGYHIPLRLEEGYGLSREGLTACRQQGATLVVSVDCGVSAVAEAAIARELGLELIITDHHTPGSELPAAVAVLNPHRSDCAFPFKPLAGVGVAFLLLVALRSALRAAGWFTGRAEPNLREYLDLVALGTVADIVPLQGVNRLLVRYGLQELTVSSRLGIVALKEAAGVREAVTSGVVGFRLAPRLNAAGRLDDAALGVELLLSADPARARQIAAQLEQSNAERQGIEQQILQDALAQLRDDPAHAGRRSIVLASADWHPGVIGIVASRLVELFHRPTVLIALQQGSGRGSARSIPALHLYDALGACAEHLVKFGGHRQAAGLTVDEEVLAAFAARFESVTAGLLTAEDLLPELWLDGELAAEELNPELPAQLARLAPFGMGNPEPVFLLRDVAVQGGHVVGGKHLKLRLRVAGRNCEAIGFGMGGRWPVPARLDLACTPELNQWQGRTSLQLRIRDLRPVEG